jgi:hypothetical protein
MIEKNLRSQEHGFRVRQPEMPEAFHLLPARQALFCPGTTAATRATIEHFWLCQSCAESMAIEVRHGGNPSLVSRQTSGNMLQLEYEL